jgi:uncharacterized damage-inducible protein DinB
MGHALHDLARHNAWATQQLLEYCRGLDEATMMKWTPGTYGSIISTLRHMIDSEMSYLFRLTGAWAERPWQADEEVGLDVLADRAEVLAATFERFLASDVDTEKLGEARSDKGEIFAVPAGIFITQIIHHANEHRAQIGSILGTLGFEPPDIDAWQYGLATGRSTVKYAPPNTIN